MMPLLRLPRLENSNCSLVEAQIWALKSSFEMLPETTTIG
jgi:hypothetical protein